MHDRLRRTRVVALVGLAALGLFLLAPGPASAHAVLEHTSPTDGAVVPSPPDTVTLTFDEAVGRIGAAATLTGPHGTVSTSPPVIAGKDVQIPVTGAQPAGSYQLAWRVVSDDGHPVSGQVRWSLHGAASAVTLAASPAAAAQSGSSSGTSWYATHGGHLLLAGLVVLLGVLYLAWDIWRRRRQQAVLR